MENDSFSLGSFESHHRAALFEKNAGGQRNEFSPQDNSSHDFTFLTGLNIEDENQINPLDKLNAQISAQVDLRKIDDVEDDDQGFLGEIMMCLDAQRVSELRNEFLKYDEGLPLHDFVAVMKATLPKSENYALLAKAGLSPLQLISNLCELFSTIDVNGDGRLEWDEFTSFIVEMGIAGNDHQPDVIQEYRSVGQVNIGRVSTHVDQIYYFEAVDAIVMVLFESRSFRIYNSSTVLRREVTRPQGYVRCIDYIAKDGWFAVSTSDLQLSFYDQHSGVLVKTFRTPSSQMCMAWIEKFQLLYTACSSGEIYAWDINEMDERFCIPRGDDLAGSEGHTDMVLQLRELEGLDLVASASMDATVRLWDPENGKHKRSLLGHTKGVRSLSYSPEYRLLVTGSFDFSVIVWNPFVEQLILRLTVHTAPIITCTIVPQSPELVTADVDGNFNIWDIRNFSCVQSFVVGESRADCLRGFVVIPKFKRLVVAARKVTMYEHLKMDSPELTDDAPVVAACFNSTSLTIMTLSGQTVKVWDSRNGKLRRVYRRLCPAELTCLCFDHRQRKFILGDHSGGLTVFNFLNGARMKAFEYSETQGRAHNNAVVRAVYCNEHSTLVTASWDGSISIHDERSTESGHLMRKMAKGHEGGDIMQLAFSYNLSLIASGASDGSIMIWDYEFGRLHDEVCGHMAPITGLLFLDPYPLLLAADGNGNLAIWGQRPSRSTSGRCLLRWQNRTWSEQVRACALVPVQVLCTHIEYCSKKKVEKERVQNFTLEDRVARRMAEVMNVVERTEESILNFESFLLLGGDEAGNVLVWNMLPILEFLEATHSGAEGIHILDEPYHCTNPYRILQYLANVDDLPKKVRRRSSLFKNSQMDTPKSTKPDIYNQFLNFDDAADLIPPQAPIVRPLATWKAHEDGVTSISAIPGGRGIMTSSFDKMVKLWKFTGECIGILRQKPASDEFPWLFIPDIEEYRHQREMMAKKVKAEIDRQTEAAENAYLAAVQRSRLYSNTETDSRASSVLSTRIPLLELARSRHASRMAQIEATLPKTERALVSRSNNQEQGSVTVLEQLSRNDFSPQAAEMPFFTSVDDTLKSIVSLKQEYNDESKIIVGAQGKKFKASEIPFSHEAYKKKIMSQKHNPNRKPVDLKNAGKSFLHIHRRLKTAGELIGSKTAR